MHERRTATRCETRSGEFATLASAQEWVTQKVIELGGKDVSAHIRASGRFVWAAEVNAYFDVEPEAGCDHDWFPFAESPAGESVYRCDRCDLEVPRSAIERWEKR